MIIFSLKKCVNYVYILIHASRIHSLEFTKSKNISMGMQYVFDGVLMCVKTLCVLIFRYLKYILKCWK